MPVTLTKARRAQWFFMQNYWKPPYQNYMTSVGLSVVGDNDPSIPRAEYSDYCIVVGLHGPLPAGTSFPSRYAGVRVFTKVAGIPIAAG